MLARRQRRTLKQLELPLPNTWGGRREGAGRKRAPGVRPAVPHRPRPVHRAAHPVHVTMRARASLPRLRGKGLFEAIREAIRAANRSPAVGRAFRVLHFSVQRDHVHLVVEAHDGNILARGMQGLGVRTARAINRVCGRRGKVWSHRFHSRDLRTPREVRNALVYVLMNFKKHLLVPRRRGRRMIDAMSSAFWFDGFKDATGPPPEGVEVPVVTPRTWLASTGWRRRGLVHTSELPAR
jgi:putative transposase